MRWALPPYITRLLGARRPQSLGSELTTVPGAINHPDTGVSAADPRAGRLPEAAGTGASAPPFPSSPRDPHAAPGATGPRGGRGAPRAPRFLPCGSVSFCHSPGPGDANPHVPASKLTPRTLFGPRSKVHCYPILRIRKPRPRAPGLAPGGNLAKAVPGLTSGAQGAARLCSSFDPLQTAPRLR